MNLFGCPAVPYHQAMDGMPLSPELERFAEDAIAAGRFRNMAEVVAAGIGLLQQREAASAAFVATLEAAEEESDRNGSHSADDVHAEMAALIDEARRTKV